MKKSIVTIFFYTLLFCSFSGGVSAAAFSEVTGLLANSSANNFNSVYLKIEEKVNALPIEEAIQCNDELLQMAATLPHYQMVFDKIYALCKFTFKRSSNDKEFLLYILGVYDYPVFNKPFFQKIILYDIGCFYFSINNFSQSATFISQYLAVNSPPKPNEEINALTTLGLIYRSRKEYDSSVIYLRKALLRATIANSYEWVGLANGNLGMVYKEMGNYADAVPHFNIDIQISQAVKSYGSAAGSFAMLGQIATIQKNLPLAKIKLDSALYLLGKVPPEHYYINARTDTYKALAEYYSATGRNDSAYHYLARAFSMTDSMQNDKKQAIIRFKITEFNLVKQQQNTLLLQASEERNEQKARFVVIIIVAALLVVSILFITIRQKQKINKMLEEGSAATRAKNVLIEQQKDKQEQLNKTKDKLFSLIAHDLRGPIGNLKTVLALVEAKAFSQEEFMSMLPEMKVKVDGVYDVADNLLRWAYAQIDGLNVKAETIYLNTIVRKVFELLESDARRKQISLESNIGPASSVFADPNLLEIIIRNLVNNAIKFSEPHTIITIESETEKGETIISVKDNGVGINDSLMEKLAKGEFSKPATGTIGEKGIGLGLVMCKEFTEANNGRIWAGQNMPKGSVFSIALPVAKS